MESDEPPALRRLKICPLLLSETTNHRPLLLPFDRATSHRPPAPVEDLPSPSSRRRTTGPSCPPFLGSDEPPLRPRRPKIARPSFLRRRRATGSLLPPFWATPPLRPSRLKICRRLLLLETTSHRPLLHLLWEATSHPLRPHLPLWAATSHRPPALLHWRDEPPLRRTPSLAATPPPPARQAVDLHHQRDCPTQWSFRQANLEKRQAGQTDAFT